MTATCLFAQVDAAFGCGRQPAHGTAKKDSAASRSFVDIPKRRLTRPEVDRRGAKAADDHTVNLSCVGSVNQPIARNECPADVVQAPGVDHVCDDWSMPLITGLGAKGCGGERTILSRCPPSKAQHLLQTHGRAIIVVDVIKIAAFAQSTKARIRLSSSSEPRKAITRQTPLRRLPRPILCRNPLTLPGGSLSHGVDITDVYADLQGRRRDADAIALEAHRLLNTLALDRCQGAEMQVAGQRAPSSSRCKQAASA